MYAIELKINFMYISTPQSKFYIHDYIKSKSIYRVQPKRNLYIELYIESKFTRFMSNDFVFNGLLFYGHNWPKTL